jgi:hypothetical protein
MSLFSIDKKIVNVTLILLTSYLTVHLLHLGFIYSCAYLIDVPDLSFYFAYVDYNVEEYTGWSRLRVILLFGMPTAMMLFSALIFWIIMSKFSFQDNSKVKLFLLWSIISCLSFVIADFISAPFDKHGVSIVADWFYIKKEVLFIFSLLFWAIIPIIGWYYSKTFMRIAYSRKQLLTKWTRFNFLAETILLPFLMVTVIFAILLIIYPGYNVDYYLSIDFIRFVVIISIFLFVMGFNFHKRYVGIKRNRELEELNYSFVSVAIISFAVIYLTLFII